MDYSELMMKEGNEKIDAVTILREKVTIVPGLSREGFRQQCQENGFRAHRWAEEHFPWKDPRENAQAKKIEVELAVVPATKLTEMEGVVPACLFATAGKLGFKPCTRAVASQVPKELLKKLLEINDRFQLFVMSEPLSADEAGGLPAILEITPAYEDEYEINSSGSLLGYGWDFQYFLFFI
ncbi:MAG: hypothetical protein ABII97_02785 [Patescibacteria group bacterium]